MVQRGLLFSLAVAAFVARPAPAQPRPSADLRRQVDSVLAGHESQWIELRRDLHRHPELSGAEERTGGIVPARLEALKPQGRRGGWGPALSRFFRAGPTTPLAPFPPPTDAIPSNPPPPRGFSP